MPSTLRPIATKDGLIRCLRTSIHPFPHPFTPISGKGVIDTLRLLASFGFYGSLLRLGEFSRRLPRIGKANTPYLKIHHLIRSVSIAGASAIIFKNGIWRHPLHSWFSARARMLLSRFQSARRTATPESSASISLSCGIVSMIETSRHALRRRSTSLAP